MPRLPQVLEVHVVAHEPTHTRWRNIVAAARSTTKAVEMKLAKRLRPNNKNIRQFSQGNWMLKKKDVRKNYR